MALYRVGSGLESAVDVIDSGADAPRQLIHILPLQLLVLFILRASPGDKVVEGRHLNGHVLELCVYDLDRLVMDGLGGGLDGRIPRADVL